MKNQDWYHTICASEGYPEDRSYCLVPDCDEQPRPGDELCETHLCEQIAAMKNSDAVTKVPTAMIIEAI